MPAPYAIRMAMVAKPVVCACLAALALAGGVAVGESFGIATVPHAHAQDSGQGMARQRRLTGQNLPVREIERRVIPQIPGAQYLGFDYDPATDIYTLKFLRNGSVIWVDVDGRTGRILRRAGG